MTKKVKKLLIILGILIVVGIVVYSTSSKSTPKTPAGSTGALSSTVGTLPLPSNTGASRSANDEFSTMLSNIKSITIDTSLFENQAYKLLRDYPVTLGSDTVGRNNPFAPIGSDGNGAPVQSVSIQTLQTGKVTSTTAEFGAQVSLADSVPTSIVFEYGTTDTLGLVTTPVTVTKSGTTLVTATKLSPETQYFVRAVAVRNAVTTTAETTSFTTTKK